jgi:hypothetical protein
MKTFLAGAVLGALAFGGARFALAPLDPEPHYHANWAVFVDGTRLDLSEDRFMEEASACGAAGSGLRPEDRVHLHDNVDEVVHVHHHGATWGHLLANLDMAVGPDYLVLPDGRPRVAEDGPGAARPVFIVNGLVVPSVHNRLIRSGDRLLISWTAADAADVLAGEFSRVARNAGAYNRRMDPATCAGHTRLGVGDRLKLAFWGVEAEAP